MAGGQNDSTYRHDSRYSIRSCSRKRHNPFSELFENGIPGGKQSRDFILAEATRFSGKNLNDEDGHSEYSNSDDSLDGFVVPDHESEGEYSENDSDTDIKRYTIRKLKKNHVIYTDSETESETEEKDTKKAKREHSVPPTCIVSETESEMELDWEPLITESTSEIICIPESPISQGPNIGDINSRCNNGSDTESDLSESLLIPAKQGPTESEMELDWEPLTTESTSEIICILESPLSQGPNIGDINSRCNNGSDTESDLSESLLIPAKQGPTAGILTIQDRQIKYTHNSTEQGFE